MSRRDEIRQARLERLARGLVDLEFRSVVVEVDGLDDVDEWRAAARLLARRSGWKVRTGVTDGGRAWAVRDDREPTPEEMRDAMQRVSDALGFRRGTPTPSRRRRRRRGSASLRLMPRGDGAPGD